MHAPHDAPCCPVQAALYEYNFLVSGSYQRAAGGGGAPDEAQQRAVRQAADAPQVRNALRWPAYGSHAASLHLRLSGTPPPKERQGRHAPDACSWAARLRGAQADGRPSSTAEAASGAAQHSTLSVSADGASLEADDAGWVVPDSLRVGSPAPSLQQITQVLGGADMERFQWAMSVSLDLFEGCTDGRRG